MNSQRLATLFDLGSQPYKNDKNMKNIDIIGIGIKGFNQITLEALNTIKIADRVYHLTLFDEELKKINKNCINLVDKYLSSKSFNIYNEFVSIILSSLDSVDRISVVNYGHPTFLVNVTQSLIRKSKEKGINCNIIPGISSIDVIWTIIKKDSGVPGMQIIEASCLIDNQIEINTQIDLYIPHITEFLIPFDRKLKLSNYPEGIKIIQQYLLKYYSENQEIAFIACSPIPSLKDKIIIVKLKNMIKKSNLEKYIRGMTLFIQNNHL